MKTIILLERFCSKCNKYVDVATTALGERFERCLTY